MRSLGFSLLTFLLFAFSAPAQEIWKTSPQDGTRQNLWGLAYDEADTLVAVGEQGAIIVSSYSGVPWQARASGSTAWLTGVGYGNSRWVVVGERGTILTSDDSGDTWIARASGTGARLNAVAYGNNRWLAVGESGTVLTSADGATWAARPALGSGFFRGLAFGQGRFLFGGANGSLYTTTDALTFTSVPIATTANIEGVAISSSQYWLVGSDGLLASATQIGAWTLAQTGTTISRGVAAKTSSAASAVGDTTVWSYQAGAWSSLSTQPDFLATAITLGKEEVVAVGFGGGVARGSLLVSVNIAAGSTSKLNGIYGTDVRLRTINSGASPISYQWTHDDVDLPGATQSELLLRAVVPSDAGSYGLRVTTATGTQRPTPVELNILPGGRPPILDTAFDATLPVVPSLIVPQPDGKLLIAGNFSVATNGGATSGLARLNRDGSLDPGFRAGPGIPVLSSIYSFVPLADGRIYAQGNFTTIAGQPRPGLARLLPDGSLAATFLPDPSVSRYAAAPWIAANGSLSIQTDLGIVRLLPSGTRDAAFPLLPEDDLFGLDSAGRLIIRHYAGSGPLTRTQVWDIKRFLPDGTRDSIFSVQLTNNFYLRLAGNNLFGTFSSYGLVGGTSTFFRLGADGKTDPGYRPPPITPYPDFANWIPFYRADGAMWDLRAGYRGWTARSYSSAGIIEPERYATMADQTDYKSLVEGPDGSLYATPSRFISGTTPVKTLVRITPITGRFGRLTNLSVRAYVSSAADPLIVGFVAVGSGATRALVRAIGPGLASFGVTDAMADPRLTLTRDGVAQATNDNWDPFLASRFASVGAFALTGGSKDAALESVIATGNYTAVITPAPGDAGTALAELYESADDTLAPRRFINVSARSRVDSARPLIVGFSITGELPATVLIRGIGPALTAFAVAGALADPQLKLYRGSTALWENDNWAANPKDADALASASASSGSFALPSGGKDAAMLVTLAPGSYTAVVSAPPNIAGGALVEIYEVPSN